MSREAMKLALEVMQNQGDVSVDEWIAAEKALQKALANEALDKMAENARELGLDYEPAQQEPVGEVGSQVVRFHMYKEIPPVGTKLYTSPPAQRTWVGLTEEELSEIYNQADWDTVNGWEYERAIEAALRSKNT